ncbi:LrgB family protein [Xenophilus azovorans]|uniref:LrgB family protein n=1 Tax=Xenophilus azovorans TaxID=151755 RepID=UPI0005713533|nr:LrgB family protein [Xenophilus azovorans]
MMTWALAGHGLVWSAATLLAYVAALRIYHGSRGSPWLIPVLTGALAIAVVLKLAGVSYASYADAMRPLKALLGPATVALAVPLYHQWSRMKGRLRPLLLALAAGSVAAIASAFLLARSLGGDSVLMASLAPKSATMPIAIPVAEKFAGQGSLAALAVAITGIVGTIVKTPLMRWMRVQDECVRGFVAGVSAHAIGMAHELQASSRAGGFAALGMCLNGVATAVLVPLAYGLASLL